MSSTVINVIQESRKIQFPNPKSKYILLFSTQSGLRAKDLRSMGKRLGKNVNIVVIDGSIDDNVMLMELKKSYKPKKKKRVTRAKHDEYAYLED